MQPKLIHITSRLVLLAGFLSFVTSLDRYPQSYIDESFYNYAAISYLHGTGFKYKTSEAAPHGDRLWAYHAPFFPRMQVATFSVFGVSEFSSRLPQYLCAYLAVAVLCECLMRRRHSFAALILAIAWIGDRSSQEVLYGRMDGIALLCLAIGYVSIVRALEQPSWWRGAPCGLSLGVAIGFHPVTIPFSAAAIALMCASSRHVGRMWAIAGLSAGAMVPLALGILAWSPDFLAAFEQFRWNFSMASNSSLSAKLTNLCEVLRWSRFWPVGLVGATVVALIPSVLRRFLIERKALSSDEHGPVWLVSCAFAVAGLSCLFTKAVFPYYLVYFTVWPIIALATTPAPQPIGGAFSIWLKMVTALVLIAWLPSLAWNSFRLRESLMCAGQLNHDHFIGELQRAVPKDVDLEVLPLFTLMAEEAGVNFTPLPWFPEQTSVSPNAWLLLSRDEVRKPHWVSRASKIGRDVIAEGDAFPGSGPFHLEYVILGPKRATDTQADRRLDWP